MSVRGQAPDPKIEIYDIDCPEPFFERGCTFIDENGKFQSCPMLTEQGYCGLVEGNS